MELAQLAVKKAVDFGATEAEAYILKNRTTQEWVKELEQLGIPCGPVNTIPEVVNDPQVSARDMIIKVHHPESGELKVVNTPFKFSRTQHRATRAAPELGEHTREVLSDLLGMTDEEIDRLRESGVI